MQRITLYKVIIYYTEFYIAPHVTVGVFLYLIRLRVSSCLWVRVRVSVHVCV